MLSRYVQKEEDLEVNKNYVIYAKPTLDKKVEKQQDFFWNLIFINWNIF